MPYLLPIGSYFCYYYYYYCSYYHHRHHNHLYYRPAAANSTSLWPYLPHYHDHRICHNHRSVSSP
jgi:hypothetical protein